MFRLHWLHVGGATRGMPRRDRGHRKPWPVLGLVACLALLQSGCQSGPFSNCGSGCGSGSGLFSPCGFFGRVSSRVFNRPNRGADCCTPGVVTEGPVEYASPATVVTPGTTVTPSYQSGSSTTPSVVAPLPPETPSELDRVEPLPKSKIVTPPASGSSSSSLLPGSKTSYQTRRQDPGSRLARRPVTLPRTTVSTPEPTSRSAQVPAGAAAANDQDPLDHLPPLDLPGEVTRSAATPPAPPAAARDDKPVSETNNKAAVKRESPAPAADDLDLTSGSTTSGTGAPPATGGIGIGRFVAVDLKLAGGSAPSSDGLKWLVDKGYRTVLDLRDSSEVPPNFIAEVTGLGLRYIALPVNVKSIDRAHVDRFNFEVAAGEARPLFFFDSDGARAGALWYIRRITNDRMDHQIARREAESLGLTDATAWTAATRYVNGLSAPRTTANPTSAAQNLFNSPLSLSGSQADQKSARPEDNSIAKPADKPSQSNVPPAAASVPARTSTDSSASPERSASIPLDSSSVAASARTVAWRPFAAMVISGLAVPLAYWSRTITPVLVSKGLASLPGSARQPKSLPGELGA